MAIIAPTPIVVPPIPEKTFTDQWIYNLLVHSPAVGTGSVSIELLPYDPIQQEIGQGSFAQTVQTDKLWQAIAEVPEVALAFQAVIDCVEPLRAWVSAQTDTVTDPIVE